MIVVETAPCVQYIRGDEDAEEEKRYPYLKCEVGHIDTQGGCPFLGQVHGRQGPI